MSDLIRGELSAREHDSDDPQYASRAGQMRWWGEVLGEHATFTGDGFRGAEANLGGGGGGFDLMKTSRWTFGVGGSYSGAGLSLVDLAGSSDFKAPRGFGYTGLRAGPLRIHAGASAARTYYTTSRNLDFAATIPSSTGEVPLSDGVEREATSDQEGWSRDSWAEIQDSFRIKSWAFDSKIGWRHLRLGREAFTEGGAGALSLAAVSQTMKLTEADILINAFRRQGAWRPRGMFMYRREIQTDDTEVEMNFVDQPDSRFSTRGLPIGRDTIMGLLELTLRTASGLQYSLKYEMRRATGELRQKLGFRVRFW
jgi:uncharacterized protein with beta-barrel porin domain